MRFFRLPVPLVTVVAVLLSQLTLAIPQAALSDSEAVAAALTEARELMDQRKWDRAKDRLLVLLNEGGASDALVACWTGIAEDLSLCTFWGAYDVPTPKEVVPEIVSWNESRGALKLRYRRGERALSDVEGGASDFVNVSDEDAQMQIYLHPIRFVGSYSIEISGRELGEPPTFFMEWIWNSFKGTAFGTAYAVSFGNLTTIYGIESGRARQLDTVSTTLNHGRKYSFEVSVVSNAISVSYNGKRQLKIKREKGEFGQFGLSDLGTFDEVELVGEVDPAWIAGLVQDRVLNDWYAFLEDYDPLEEASSDLRNRIEGRAYTMTDFGMRYPGPVDERNDPVLAKAKVFFDDAQYEEGLQYVDNLSVDATSAPAREWMRANFLLYTGDVDAGYEALERVVDADPTFFEGRLYHTRVGYSRKERLKSLDEHERLLRDFSAVLRAVRGDGAISPVRWRRRARDRCLVRGSGQQAADACARNRRDYATSQTSRATLAGTASVCFDVLRSVIQFQQGGLCAGSD